MPFPRLPYLPQTDRTKQLGLMPVCVSARLAFWYKASIMN